MDERAIFSRQKTFVFGSVRSKKEKSACTSMTVHEGSDATDWVTRNFVDGIVHSTAPKTAKKFALVSTVYLTTEPILAFVGT